MLNKSEPLFEASLIADNGYHKISFSKNGKHIKLVIAKIFNSEVTADQALTVVNDVMLIINGEYSKRFLEKAQLLINNYGLKSRFHPKAIELASRIMEYDEIEVEEFSKENIFKILNMGESATGKSSFTLNAVIKKEFLYCFSPLVSIRETTSFGMETIINDNNSDSEVEIVLFIKSPDEIKRGIENIIIDTYYETLNTIGNIFIENSEAQDAFQIACEDLVDRVKKTQDNTINLNRAVGSKIEQNKNEFYELLKGIFLSVEKKMLNSASYDREEYNESIIKSIEQAAHEAKKSNKMDLLEKRVLHVMDTPQAKQIIQNIQVLLDNLLKEFCEDYKDVFVEINKRDEMGEVRKCFKIKKEIGSNKQELDETKMLFSVIFDNKAMINKPNFYTISPLISYAEVKVPYYDATSELPKIRIIDTVGLNQKKEEVKNQISGYLQKHKPNMILYHTRLDQKDSALISNIEFINLLGYGKRTKVVYGRFDSVLEQYYEDVYPEEKEALGAMNPQDIDTEGLLTYLRQEYLKSDIQTLEKVVGKGNLLLCDKKQKYASLNQFSPKHFIQTMEFSSGQKEQLEFKNTFKDEFIKCLYRTDSINGIYTKFVEEKVPEILPMEYRKLIWSPVQKAIEEMYYNREGWGRIQPALLFKSCVLEILNTESIKIFLDGAIENRDNFIREFLEQISDLSKFFLISQYKIEYEQLLRLRFETDFRKMPWTSMTDERKIRLRNDFQSRLTAPETIGKTFIIENLIEVALKIVESEKI